MRFQNLSNLFEHLLQDMYYAENRANQMLPDVIEKADNSDLKTTFESHVDMCKEHINKLEKVFETTGTEKTREKCEAIEGIMKENIDIVEACEDDTTRDAALILGAQKVKHYKIASYGTLCAMSEKLGHNDATPILKEILEQSKKVDVQLTKLAEKIDVAEPVA